jgi:hypothetical protein
MAADREVGAQPTEEGGKDEEGSRVAPGQEREPEV